MTIAVATLTLICISMFLVAVGYLYCAAEIVRIGMEEREVEAILGGPGGLHKFRTEQELQILAESMGMAAPPGATMKYWPGNPGRVYVVFDRDGRAASVRYPRGIDRHINKLVHAFGFH